jgi:type VI secretion system protein ImpA
MSLPDDDLLKPIEGASPCGVNLRYDPVYDEIKEARREEDDVPQGEWQHARKTADYKQVMKIASAVLATKSKDLQIAAWLTEALLRQEGFAGLHAGLELLRSLLEQFWEHVYPELEDGDAELRAAPLEWVGLYLDPAVKSVGLTKAGHDFWKYREARTVGSEADAEGDVERVKARKEAIDEGKLTLEEFDKAFTDTPKVWYKQLVAQLAACVASIRTLDTLGSEKFGDAAPVYRKLQTALDDVQEVAQQLLARKLELDPDPPEPEPAVEAMSMGAEPHAGAADTLPIEPTSVDDAASRIAAAARFLHRADPRNPGPYLMLRGLRWGELRASGRDVDPRLLAAPPTQIRTHLKGLLLDGRWPELLEAAEGVMATPHGRGWLDLQRYVLTACVSLGPEYDYVADAIRGELRTLLRDLPQLPELTLMDDTATANAETRSWLREEGLPFGEGAGPPAPEPEAAADAAPASVPRAPRRSVSARAAEAARSGQAERGIELLMREAEQEKSARARFLRRSQAAGIMVDTGRDAVAKPILKELLGQIERHQLEEWEEGNMVARPLGLLYRCLQVLGDDAEVDREDLYRRICRLDPLQAIGFRGTEGASATQAVPTELPSDAEAGS